MRKRKSTLVLHLFSLADYVKWFYTKVIVISRPMFIKNQVIRLVLVNSVSSSNES